MLKPDLSRIAVICFLFLTTLGALAQDARPPTNVHNVASHEVKAWQRQAANGDALAQYWLGKAYLSGWYLEPDSEAAFEWFKKSSDQDFESGLNALAICYQTGTGTETNLTQALSLLTPLAERGYPLAQYNLGRSYLKGLGVQKDPILAREWLEKSAEQDDPDAMCLLADMYKKGLGVEANPQTAFRWLERAAAQKSPSGHYLLGTAHELGIGTEPRLDKALEEYEKAVNYGHSGAMMALSDVYQNKKKDPAQSFYWLTEAAQAGHPQAEFLMGGSYYYGESVRKDLKEAKVWFERAHAHGHPKAADFLQRIRERSRRP